MSGLEAFGLACNIIQIISFAHETVSLCQTIYNGRSPSTHLKETAQSLADLSAQIHSDCQAIQPLNADERSLVDIANKCNIAARALEEETSFILQHQKKGNLVATFRVTVKTVWRRRRLDRQDKQLQSYRSTMETHLLARIW